MKPARSAFARSDLGATVPDMSGAPGTSPLAPNRVAGTARLLATALYDDPAYGILFPQEKGRRAGLEAFFTGHLRTHLPHRCTFVRVGDEAEVQATVTLRPPGGIATPAGALIRAVVPFALAHGLRVVPRLSQVKNLYEKLEERAAEGKPYWHIHMMAVRPERQGQGIGGSLLEDVLGAVPAGSAPIVLTTHKEINVRFYQRAAFEVVHRETVHPSSTEPYEVWCMRREPA